MNNMNKIINTFLFGMIFLSSLLGSYMVGEQISISDQQINMNICNGNEQKYLTKKRVFFILGGLPPSSARFFNYF